MGRRLFLYLISSVVLLICLLVSSAFAQKKTDISVSPAIIEFSGDRGDSKNVMLSIRNSGETSLPLSFEVQSLFSNGVKVASAYDASTWISLGSETVIFEPGESKELAIRVDVPEDASPGGHYAQLSVRGLVLANDDVSSITVPEVSVSLLMTISGDINEALEFSDHNIVPWQSEPGATRQLSVMVTNTGNVHNLITPELVVMKGDQEIDRLRFGSRVVLPGTITTFSREWTAPDYGAYRVFAQLTAGSKGVQVVSNTESLLVTPPLYQLIFMFFGVSVCAYLLIHRNNIAAAYKELLK